MNRTGKIARLPRSLREELNRRLERNIPGRLLVGWLNSLPEVQEIMNELFHGKPVSPQNLSEWRQGGFAEWQTRCDLLERLQNIASSSEEIEATCGSMADHAACLLSSQIALMLGDPREEPNLVRLRQLSSLIRDIAILRRGDHSAARLKIQESAFDLAKNDHETRGTPRKAPHPRPALRKPHRHAPRPAAAASAPTGKSNLIKPDQTIREEDSAPSRASSPSAPVATPKRSATVASTRRSRSGIRRKPRRFATLAAGKSPAHRRESASDSSAA